jgi:hypothetical protein
MFSTSHPLTSISTIYDSGAAYWSIHALYGFKIMKQLYTEIHLTLILLPNFCIGLIWVIMPIFRRYKLPPFSGSKRVSEQWTTHLEPEDKASMYLRIFENTAHIHIIQEQNQHKQWTTAICLHYKSGYAYLKVRPETEKRRTLYKIFFNILACSTAAEQPRDRRMYEGRFWATAR